MHNGGMDFDAQYMVSKKVMEMYVYITSFYGEIEEFNKIDFRSDIKIVMEE